MHRPRGGLLSNAGPSSAVLRTGSQRSSYLFIRYVQTILEVLRKHLDNRQRHRVGVKATLPVQVVVEEDLWDACFAVFAVKGSLDQSKLDATASQIFRGELVRAARKLERKYFKNKNVYSKVPRSEAFQRTNKAPITVK